MINEAINIEKQVIFIAIPKTGSTSIRFQVREIGKPIIRKPHLNIIQIRDLIYCYLLKKNIGQTASFPHEQVATDAALRAKAADIFNSFFKFAAVRNPWARAVSLYFRREGIPVSERMSFEEFCRHHAYASDTCRKPTLHVNQYDWLCDEEGHNLMDYVYKIENLAQAIPEINERTHNVLQLKEVVRNENPNSASKKYRKMYNDETRQLIAKRFEKDIDMFKYTF